MKQGAGFIRAGSWTIAALIFSAFLVLSFSNICSLKLKPLGWDEIDYVNATKMGVVNNYLEINSLTLPQFIRIGRLKQQGKSEELQVFGQSLPPEEKSPFFNRHFHPPLLIYVTSILQKLTAHSWVYAMVGCFLLLFFMALPFSVYGITPQHLPIAVTILLSCLFSPIFYNSSGVFNFHIVFALSSSLFLFAILKWKEDSQKYWPFLAISIAVLFLALETAVFVFSITSVAFVVIYKGWRGWGQAWKPLLGGIVVFYILWPGALKSGEPFRAWAMYLYRFVFAGNAEYSDVRYLTEWLEIIAANWLLLFVCISSLLLIVFQRKSIKRHIVLLLVTGIGYCIFLTPFIKGQTYVLPGLYIVSIGAVLAWMDYLGRHPFLYNVVAQMGIVVLLVVQVSVTGMPHQQIKKMVYSHQNSQRQINTFLDEVGSGPYLLFGGHIYQYYFPEWNITNLHVYDYTKPGFWVREDYAYKNIEEAVSRKEFGTIMLDAGLPLHEVSDFLNGLGYDNREINGQMIYYLPKENKAQL